MRSPVVVFPFLVELHTPAPAGAGISGVNVPYDPRRASAEVISRTRRAPPPIEDDTAETLWVLTWVLLFVLAVWWT